MAKGKSQQGRVKKWNSRIHYFLIAGFLLLIFIPMINKTPSQEVVDQSMQAAMDFLVLVDNSKYAESWDIASPHLQKSLDRNEWSEKMADIRGAVGPIIERVRDDIVYLGASGDLPEGDYVVITFVSKFQAKKRVTESVTLHLTKDSTWQVAGYYLQ